MLELVFWVSDSAPTAIYRESTHAFEFFPDYPYAIGQAPGSVRAYTCLADLSRDFDLTSEVFKASQQAFIHGLVSVVEVVDAVPTPTIHG